MIGAFRLNTLAKTIIDNITIVAYKMFNYIINPDPFPAKGPDGFGSVYGLAMNENYILVGASGEGTASATSVGKAYLFNKNTKTVQTISSPNGATSDTFGYAVAMDNNYYIISAPYIGSLSGTVWLYTIGGGSITLFNPTPFGTGAGDFFGGALAIFNGMAIVTANSEGDAGGTSSGKAYAYDMSGNLIYTFDNPNSYGASTNDTFGISVALNDTYIAIGALGEDQLSYTGSGVVYVYRRSDYGLQYTLNDPNAYGTPTSDGFGVHIKMNTNNQLLIGTQYEDDATGGQDSGKAYIYDLNSGTLQYTLNNPTPLLLGHFGSNSLAINNNYAVIGNNTASSNAGKTYVYSLSDGSLAYTFNNPNVSPTVTTDAFGVSVAISNNHIAVGSSEGVFVYSNISTDIPAALTTLTLRTNISATTASITVPATAQVGDIAIIFNMSTTVTDVIPVGWTSIISTTTTGIRSSIVYKKLLPSDIGAAVTLSSGTTNKIMLIYYGNAPIMNVVPSAILSQSTTVDPTLQTIAMVGKPTPAIAIASYASTGAVSVRSWSTGTTIEYASTSASSVLYAKTLIFNSGSSPADTNVSMTDGGSNSLVSLYLQFNGYPSTI